MLLQVVVAVVVGSTLFGGYAWWLYRRLAVAPDWSPRGRRAVLVMLAVGALVWLVASGLLRQVDPGPVRPLLWLGMTEIAVAIYTTIGIALLAVVAYVLRRGGRDEVRRRVLRRGTPTVVVLALAVTGYGVVEALDPDVARHDLAVADLPPGFDEVRIALVTDLHVGPLHDASWTQRIVDLVMAEEPDLVVLGGDLVDGSPEDIARYLAPLAELDAPLGVVAVTGNHEMFGGEDEAAEWVAVYESLGIDVLGNESVVRTRGGDEITVVGVHDPAGEGALAYDPDAAFAGVDPDGFTLFVAHQPNAATPGRGVDLQLSGHTHGGQLWPVHLVVPFEDPVTAGLGEADGVPVFVSRGVGTSGPPARVLAPPQVDLMTLHDAG